MHANLNIPNPASGGCQTFPLRLGHKDGKTVFFSSHGHCIDGSYFQFLRERMGATIETTDPSLVAGVLALPLDDAGIIVLT